MKLGVKHVRLCTDHTYLTCCIQNPNICSVCHSNLPVCDILSECLAVRKFQHKNFTNNYPQHVLLNDPPHINLFLYNADGFITFIEISVDGTPHSFALSFLVL